MADPNPVPQPSLQIKATGIEAIRAVRGGLGPENPTDLATGSGTRVHVHDVGTVNLHTQPSTATIGTSSTAANPAVPVRSNELHRWQNRTAWLLAAVLFLIALALLLAFSDWRNWKWSAGTQEHKANVVTNHQKATTEEPKRQIDEELLAMLDRHDQSVAHGYYYALPPAPTSFAGIIFPTDEQTIDGAARKVTAKPSAPKLNSELAARLNWRLDEESASGPYQPPQMTQGAPQPPPTQPQHRARDRGEPRSTTSLASTDSRALALGGTIQLDPAVCKDWENLTKGMPLAKRRLLAYFCWKYVRENNCGPKCTADFALRRSSWPADIQHHLLGMVAERRGSAGSLPSGMTLDFMLYGRNEPEFETNVITAWQSGVQQAVEEYRVVKNGITYVLVRVSYCGNWGGYRTTRPPVAPPTEDFVRGAIPKVECPRDGSSQPQQACAAC